MKRAWMLILLVSLGLNVGLAIKVFNRPDDGGRRHGDRRWGERRMEGRNWPAPDDTTRMREMGRRRMERIRTKLDLSADQAAALQANQERAVGLLAGKREEIEEIRTRIRTLMGSDAVDREAVRAAHSDLGRKQAELDSLVAEIVLDDLQVLTPAQREGYLRLHPFGQGGRREPSHGGGRGSRDRGPE